MKNIVMQCIIIFFLGCSCKVQTLVDVQKPVTSKMLHKVTKVEYEYLSPSFRPDLTYKEVISLTNTTIKKEKEKNSSYTHGSLKVDADTLQKIKTLMVESNISKCSKTKIDCFTNKQIEDISTGCSSKSLSLYVGDKKIFSEYISCHQGKLCGDYMQIFDTLENLSKDIQLKKIDYSTVEPVELK